MDSQTSQAIVDEQITEWAELEYPLTLQEMQRLSWLQEKIAAVEWLANHDSQEAVDFQHAGRLAFCRWLVASGRLHEDIRA